MLCTIASKDYTTLDVAGHETRFSSPGKVYFPEPGWTKLDLAEYYILDSHDGRIDGLLDLACRDDEGGLGDAPWRPSFAKQPGEPKRVQPSRAKKEP